MSYFDPLFKLLILASLKLIVPEIFSIQCQLNVIVSISMLFDPIRRSWCFYSNNSIDSSQIRTHLWYACMRARSLQSYLTLCDGMDCSPPCFSVLGIDSPGKKTTGDNPFPAPEDLPNLGTEPVSLMSPVLAGVFFTTSTTWGSPWYT